MIYQYTSNPIDKNVIYHDVSFYVSNPIKEEKKDDSSESTEEINVKGINQIIKLILRILKNISKMFK